MMRFKTLLLSSSLLGLVGCLHTRTASEAPASADAKDSAKGSKTSKDPERATGGSGTTARSAEASPSSQPHKEGASRAAEGHPHLASDPLQLRQPGGTEKIAKALHDRGFLTTDTNNVDEQSLTVAVRHFQKSQEIAQTGFADNETLRRLGLNPKDVDKSQAKRNESESTTKAREERVKKGDDGSVK